MSKEKPPRSITLTLNPEHKEIFVKFSDDPISTLLESEDGKSVAGVHFAPDFLPIVTDITIYDDAKYSLIEDWIEAAIEGALGDMYGDDHYKANLLGDD